MRLKKAWVDECVFILRRSILKSPASSMLLFKPFILDNMQSRSALKSPTECPGERYTTPAVMSFLLSWCNLINIDSKVLCMCCSCPVSLNFLIRDIILYKKSNITTPRTLSASGYKAVSWDNHTRHKFRIQPCFCNSYNSCICLSKQQLYIRQFMKQTPAV